MSVTHCLMGYFSLGDKMRPGTRWIKAFHRNTVNTGAAPFSPKASHSAVNRFTYSLSLDLLSPTSASLSLS